MAEPLLDVQNLEMVFENKYQAFTAVDHLSFSVEKGQTLGIVGESGSGKTMASLSVMKLLPNQGRVSGGKILFEGKDQVYTVGSQIVEAILTHEPVGKKQAEERALELLTAVGIAQPERVFRSYPFELSGGMCQRVMIAIALSCNPKLLFADEPTTALDVTVQAQILDLLRKVRDEYQMGIVLITHDLGVVSDIADRVIVMYAGKSMEDAPTDVIMNHPAHPYTMGLIQSAPKLEEQVERLHSIEGAVPDIRNMPKGCRFCTRCPQANDLCRETEPQVREIAPGHFVRCHYAGN